MSRAMVLDAPGRPLRSTERAVPEPGAGELLIGCARAASAAPTYTCSTASPARRPPRRAGHQIVGAIAGHGRAGRRAVAGLDLRRLRVLPSGRENLCERARFTGRDIDGGFAEYAVADERFCFPIPDGYPDLQAAPLLCAGLIGYRALRMSGDARARSASTASARPRTSSARSPSRRAAACSRSRARATRCAGASRASSARSGRATRTRPRPKPLDAALVFAPAGALVPAALRALARAARSSAPAST